LDQFGPAHSIGKSAAGLINRAILAGLIRDAFAQVKTSHLLCRFCFM
jgi:hypothetical protein